MKKIRLIKEDLAKAKKLVRNREMLRRAADELGLLNKDSETARAYSVGVIKTLQPKHFSDEEMVDIKKVLQNMKMTPEDIKSIERDEEFQKIVKMCSKHIGWTFMFVYFYYYENASIEELEDLLNDLIDKKGLLKNLEKPFDINYINPSNPHNMEDLVDGLEKLEINRAGKKMFGQLTPELKISYRESTEYLKKKFDEVAVGFAKAGTKKGVLDKELNLSIWKSFFGQERLDTHKTLPDGTPNENFGKMVYFSELKRYSNLQQFLDRAEKYLDSLKVEGVSDFIEEVNKINQKLGNAGVEIVENENNIIIAIVKSFTANNLLNGRTSHCIANYLNQWENYVSRNPNLQYYVYNFNLNANTNNLCVIGLTMRTDGRFDGASGASDIAFDKNNVSITKGNLYTIFDKWDKDYDLSFSIKKSLKPMNEEDARKWEIRVNSSKGILRTDLTVDQLNDYVLEGGADVNSSFDNKPAFPLYNAVDKDDYELVKRILELGGNPTMYDKLGNSVKSIEVMRLLVPKGITFENATSNLSMIYEDYNDFEWFIKNGFNPNFNLQIMVRMCIMGSYVNKDNIGEAYNKQLELMFKNGAWVKSDRDHNAAKVGDNKGKETILEWSSRYCRIDTVKMLDEMGILAKAEVDFMDYFRAIIQVLKVNGNANLDTLEASVPRNLQIETCDYYMEKIIEECERKKIPHDIDSLILISSKGSNLTEEHIMASTLPDEKKEQIKIALQKGMFEKIRCVLIPSSGKSRESVFLYLNTK